MMNETIKELFVMAGGRVEGELTYTDENFDPIRFAYLIVNECADIASINQFQYDAVGNYVKKHFEV